MGFNTGFGPPARLSDKVAIGKTKTIQFNDNGVLSGHDDLMFDKDKKALIVPGISGSLTALCDGSPYLRAGSNITLTTGSGGWVTITSTGGGEADHDKLKKLVWSDSGHTSTAFSLPVFDSDGKAAKVNAPQTGERSNKVLTWISETSLGWVTVGSGAVLMLMLESDLILDALEYNADVLASRNDPDSWSVPSSDPVVDENVVTNDFSLGSRHAFFNDYDVVENEKQVVSVTGLYGTHGSSFNANTDIVDPKTNFSVPPQNIDGPLDSDGDGIPNVDEDVNQNNIQDPGETDPYSSDSDSDGLIDGQEITAGTNPLDPDSDDDGVVDGADSNPTNGSIT